MRQKGPKDTPWPAKNEAKEAVMGIAKEYGFIQPV